MCVWVRLFGFYLAVAKTMHRIGGAEKNSTIKAYEKKKTNYCIKRPRSTNFIPSTHTHRAERERAREREANTEKHCAKSNESSFFFGQKAGPPQHMCVTLCLLYGLSECCKSDGNFVGSQTAKWTIALALLQMQSNHEKKTNDRKKREELSNNMRKKGTQKSEAHE